MVSKVTPTPVRQLEMGYAVLPDRDDVAPASPPKSAVASTGSIPKSRAGRRDYESLVERLSHYQDPRREVVADGAHLT
jgi:hypothetical protein